MTSDNNETKMKNPGGITPPEDSGHYSSIKNNIKATQAFEFIEMKNFNRFTNAALKQRKKK